MKRFKTYLGLTLLIPSLTYAGNLSSICTELQNSPQGKPSKSLDQKLNDKALLGQLRNALKSSAEIRDALCIVSSAKKSELLEDVLHIPYENLKPEVFSTLYALRTDQNQSAIETQAFNWIKDPSSEGITLRVVGSLNLLAMLKSIAKIDLLSPLFSSQNTDIKIRAYEYFFHHYSDYSKKDRQPLLKTALTGHPYQLRIAAIEHYRTLSEDEKNIFRAELVQCKKDPIVEVREECP